MQTKRMTFPGRWLPYALLTPQVIVTLIFFIWPSAQALYMSLLREDAFGLNTTFVGFVNFTRLLADGTYLNSLSVTAVFALGTTLLSMSAALLLAANVNRMLRSRNLYTTLLVWPYAVAPAIAGVLWWFIFTPSIGIVPYVLEMLGYRWNHRTSGVNAMVLVSPSSCGKSSLLRMVAGLDTISEGKLCMGERRVNDLEPAQRDIAMVFQNYALYPHMAVFNNLAYGLKNRGFKRDEIQRRVEEAAKMLEIEAFLPCKPRQLSGSQRQRVAMGRALVREPAAFLFDEPLSNLDAKLRVQMRVEIKQLQRRLKTTSLYVTHDQRKAMTLGDRLVVLNEGRIEQVGTPMEIYARPASLFVAAFIGSPAMNLVPKDYLESSGLGANGDAQSVKTLLHDLPPDTDIVGIHPDDLRLQAPREPHLTVAATLELFEAAGADSHLYVRLAGRDEPMVIRTAGQPPVAEGETLHVYMTRDALHPFH